MKIHLHIDPFSGIAGDMFLGALIDLGAKPEAITAAMGNLPTEKPWELAVDRVSRHGIGAIDLKVAIGEKHDHTHVHTYEHGSHDHHHNHEHKHSHEHSHDHAHHHHTNYHDIMHMIDHLDVADRAKERARDVVTRLGEAEARVHQTTLDKIHFHEVGAVDSIVDMLGSCVALELLNIDSLSCGTLPISTGFVNCAHGKMPVPAPATAYLLESLPTQGVDRKGELITPTGAAIVRALTTPALNGSQPAMTISATGYGAGDRENPDIPNLLRLSLGSLTPQGTLTPN
ncbi:LarC family nickel insertion protein [Poriferisphaera sp. WC338]|uniref:LarC family nickel insertion protein n=1 Tax=Poriferisphaera sp. WC338 TaxID=3425129 RepID=UPI003D814EBD